MIFGIQLNVIMIIILNLNMIRTKVKKINFNEKFGNEENEKLILSKFQTKRTLNE